MKYLIVAAAAIILYGYFYAHHLDDYYRMKIAIKELIKDW
jgi:hypothetical protein